MGQAEFFSEIPQPNLGLRSRAPIRIRWGVEAQINTQRVLFYPLAAPLLE